jgi:UDP-2-acetamido-3-amino-2,3-dideoxy-glucuronate N-acetyltransferase
MEVALYADTENVAVIGSGYWGKNLVRTFHNLGCLKAVCDLNEQALAEARDKYNVKTTQNIQDILRDKDISAVVVAAPAAQHYAIVKEALRARKHVLVEKPLALRCSEGEELVELADSYKCVLMVGHILEYHPAVQELKRLIDSGELGKIQYIYSSRLNLGKLRTEENILWSFAPHDISVILSLLGERPVRVSSHGGTYLNPPLVDTTLSTLEFASGVKAHIFVSWLHPFKEQKLTVVGSQKMAVFDDVQTSAKLVVYSHRISWANRKPVAEKDAGQAIAVPLTEPLRNECEHFLNSIRRREQPQTNGRSALRVLEVLEGCERSLATGGVPVQAAEKAEAYSAHPTAVVDESVEIGAGTRIWHFSHIMSGSKIGCHCNLGQNVVVSPGVVIGNNVKIQNNVSVYTGVTLEDDVFCGPSMVFTNVINPRSHISRRHEYQATLVRSGATLGANSTIVCGSTIGRYAFVAAGAVITRDVPDYALMIGVPARQTGWVCECGIRLSGDGPGFECNACMRRYELAGKILHPAKSVEDTTGLLSEAVSAD